LDFLRLQDTYSERDLEAAILRELEKFLLEKLIYTVADDLFINTATGDSPDKLVIDRLPDGRSLPDQLRSPPQARDLRPNG